MIRWSPIKLKFTLGVGSLASTALFSEMSQKAIPAWLAVGIVILPLVVFMFADPDDISRSVAQFLQVVASLWYLVLNSTLAVLFVAQGPKLGCWLMLVLLAVGAVPCLIVIGRAVVPPDEPAWKSGILLPLDRPAGDFSEPVVFRPKKVKMFLFLLLALAFVAGGVLMLQEGEAFGWLVVAFFGLGVVVLALQFLPNCSYLRVSSSGIEFRSLWRRCSYNWTDISHFFAGRIGGNKMVLYDFSPSYHEAHRTRSVSKAVTGAEAALPDTYGFTAEALADYLNQWMVAQLVRPPME